MEGEREIDILNLIDSYNENCPICFEELTYELKTIKLECKHTYCYTCFIEMYIDSLNNIKGELKGECCYCRKDFIYKLNIKNDLILIIKGLIPRLITGVFRYIILLYFTFCLTFHGVSLIYELSNSNYTQIKSNNLFTTKYFILELSKLLNCISYILFIANQILVFNSIELLFENNTRWVYKLPSYTLLYTISISILYLNMKLI